MTDELRPAGVFQDLSTDRATLDAIKRDAPLSVDEFASKHGPTIRQHYAKGGYQMDAEEGHQTAAQLWRYLREP